VSGAFSARRQAAAQCIKSVKKTAFDCATPGIFKAFFAAYVTNSDPKPEVCLTTLSHTLVSESATGMQASIRRESKTKL
jgi:hypothetical protein